MSKKLSKSGAYRRLQKIAAVKARGNRCQDPDCPLPSHPYWNEKQFEFDHIEPIKRGRGTKGNNKGERREDQGTMYSRIIHGKALDIVMLCANCHKLKSYNERHKYV